ncbi:TIGR01906 family membrane protein [Periweissella ghanensis]|uniref:TIGR01906 family membrane protein n=1 Tax=Periweissella ghanensis TaxID=467997 RepID=A0ABN8BPD7_9LACO|nr:TIGR01906 family membrane protein [Periweissella ghanensis]MCM0600647.1 TIGR01906 family membrane protein [Periweissella ghanensis]CAH0418463.1 hypothetical protein WGH24286_00881 [Periweissella ghanensis]
MIGKFKFWVAFISLLLCIISLAITITINSTWLYYLNVLYGNFLPLVNLSPQMMMHNFHQLMAYLNLPWITELKMSNFTDSKDGLEHFREVKHLFLINYLVLLVTIWPSGLFIKKLHRQQEQWRLLWPLQAVFAGIFILLALMIMQFNQFFIAFHKILFRNNDWIFYPVQDPIINALPESYFNQSFTLFFGLVIVALASLYFWATTYFKKRKKKHHK